MRVFLTGATGFVGGHLLAELTSRGHEVTCLVRRASAGRLPEGVRQAVGDATRPEGLAEAMRGMDAAIHLVGIIREFSARGVTFRALHVEATRNLLRAAAEAGVSRYLHMSSNGARPNAPSPYHQTKWAAEELVRASGLAWTIFRPSVIFGPGDGFVNLLAGVIRRAPVVPVVGSGRYLLQPVSVATVAAGFALALERPETAGRGFGVCGPQRLSYERVLDTVAEALGRGRPRKLHVPVGLMRAAAGMFGRFSWFPLTSDHLTMLLEGNVCDPGPFEETFGLPKIPFEGSLGYLPGSRR